MLKVFFLFTLFAKCPEESRLYQQELQSLQQRGQFIEDQTTNHVHLDYLKLMDHATSLIQQDVNDHLPPHQQISYATANEMLFEAITYVKHFHQVGLLPEVPLTVIKILQDCSWEKAEEILSSAQIK
jgi:hypothetical protein